MPYRVETESSEKKMLKKKKRKKIAGPIKKGTFFDMDIFET